MRNFRNFTIWQDGIELAVKTYELTKLLPKEENYGLRSQITRAVISIPSNIAEGSSRSSEKDFKRFLEISLGSAYELETDLVIIEKIGLIKSSDLEEVLSAVTKEQRQINALISKIRSL